MLGFFIATHSHSIILPWCVYPLGRCDLDESVTRTAAALLPALKEVRRQREPRGLLFSVPVQASDGVSIDCTLIAGDPDKVVVVAHPAVVGSRYRQVVALADELSCSFSVLLFDFRGHGRSGGS